MDMDMDLYALKENGATYWICAHDRPDALRAWAAMAEDNGHFDESIEGLESIELIEGEDADKVRLWTDDTGKNTEPMMDAVKRATGPEVLSCSEWP